MEDHLVEPWAEEEHIICGSRVLDQLNHPRDEVWTASCGYNDRNERQILVFGLSNLEILSPAGDVLLDVGHKEVRGIRRVENIGVEVCVSGAVSGTEIRPRRWAHRVSDQDAQYLEEHWLNLTPVTHSGVGLNSLHWREDEYAYFVGRVVTEAAKCEVTLAELAITGMKLLGKDTEGVHGESGSQLAKFLTDLGAKSPAIAEIAERYDAWHEWRNFAVHGIRARDARGHVTEQVFKVPRAKQARKLNVSIQIMDQDFERLALAWHAFYMLNHDAWATRMLIPPTGGTQQLLWDLPMSTSVSDKGRLPPIVKS